jgi:hypothetical protein
MMMPTKHEVASVQNSCNHFTHKYLRGVAPLHVDGKLGHATQRRIKWIKWYLGYGKHVNDNTAAITSKFVRSLRHPKSPRYTSPRAIAAGASRRVRQRREWARHQKKAHATHGVSHFDGVPVASWLVWYLEYARAHGWHGRLVSGWRDPAYSESLCRRMCGAPSCPGRCAGRSSNHSGSVSPHGAIDVSDYENFGRIIRGHGNPHIFNALGAQDPVHFSASGR